MAGPAVSCRVGAAPAAAAVTVRKTYGSRSAGAESGGGGVVRACRVLLPGAVPAAGASRYERPLVGSCAPMAGPAVSC